MTVSHVPSARSSVPAPSETRVPEWLFMGKPPRAGCRRPKSFPTISSCEALRRLPVPVGLELVAVRDIEDARLGEVRADDLQADGQSADEAAGNGQGGQPGEIRADGVNVVEIHGDGIGGLGADAKRGRGAR